MTIRRIDLTGQTFGAWTVLRFSHRDRNNGAHWLCKCACGTEKPVLGSSLREGTSERCRPCSDTRRRQDTVVVGQRYGRWTVLADSGRPAPKTDRRFLCRCDCGNEREVVMHNLVRGYSTQCALCARRYRKLKPKE